MNIYHVDNFDNIPNYIVDDVYKLLKNFKNEERLLICMYLLHETEKSDLNLKNIENNLRKIFPPAIKSQMLPDDYTDFQASVIRGHFDREKQKVKNNQMDSLNRYWFNLEETSGKWINTHLANIKAVELLKENSFKIKKKDNIEHSEDKISIKNIYDIFYGKINIPRKFYYNFFNKEKISVLFDKTKYTLFFQKTQNNLYLIFPDNMIENIK